MQFVTLSFVSLTAMLLLKRFQRADWCDCGESEVWMWSKVEISSRKTKKNNKISLRTTSFSSDMVPSLLLKQIL